MKRWMAQWTILATAGAAVNLAGCSPAREAGPVVEVQREAAEELARRSVRDAAALRAATGALLEVRRAALVARLETAALEAVFAGEPLDVAGWSEAESAAWTARFESVIDDAPARRRLAAELPASREFDAGATALLDALEAREAATAALVADLLASTAVVEAAVEGDVEGPSPLEVLREIYEQELRERIDGPERREAVDRILDRLLGPTSEGGER